MGALAITTLAGSLFVLHAPAAGSLADLTPFVKGFSPGERAAAPAIGRASYAFSARTR